MIKTKEILNKIIKLIKNNKWIHYFIIVIIGIILSVPLSQIQIRDTHDGSLHLLRLIGTMDTLQIGQFPPLINQNYCNGSGYSMNLFYPPIVTYLPLLIKLFTSNYTIALKIFAGICIVLSGITMYQFAYQVTKKRGVALFTAIFYLIAPYKLANVYKRFAIGEFTAAVFIPLVFLGLINLFEQDKKKHYYIAIGAIGLLLSHTVTTLYTLFFCILYIVFHLRKLKEKEIIQKCIINIIFILLVTMLFWLPLIEATSAAEYAIMDDSIMKTNGLFATQNTISFSQLFKDIGEVDGTTFLIGLPTIVAILLTILVIKKVDMKDKDFYLLSLIFALISVFMVSKFFPWRIMPNLLCKLQYPWRMIGFFNFFISYVCGINLFVFLKQIKQKEIFKILIIFVFVLWSVGNSIGILSQFYAADKEKDAKYETRILENRKISHRQINREYMPVKTILLQNTYVLKRQDNTYVLKGSAEITEEKKQDLRDELKIKNIKQNTHLEFPYYYYPGYQIQLRIGEEIQKLQPIESENGYLSCLIEQEIQEGTIVVEYVGTPITYIAYSISAISLLVFIVYIIKERRKE